MKRFFISAIVSMGCFMAHAQSIIPTVNIVPGGTKTVDVTIPSGTSYTAFQFDVALPTGVSLKSATFKSKGETREITSGKVGSKYRVLSYDMKNEKLTSDEVLSLTFAATSEFTEDAEAPVDGIVLVDPEGNQPEGVTGGNVAIKVADGATITIGESGKTTYVCSSGLDFTDSDAKAYVITGIDAKNVWMTRILTVPANTPIVVKGDAGDHVVAKADVKGADYKNFLIGNNTDAAINVTPEGGDQFLRLGTKGFSRFTDTKSVGAHKAYIRANALPAAKSGSSVPVTIGDGLRTSLCADVDLDFSEAAVKAYIATGYDGTIWLARVMTASAGTPLYIRGDKGSYTIPSVATQTVYANMLVGNNTENSITINATDGDYTNFFIGTSGFSKVKDTRNVSAHKSYLQILTSCLPAAARGFSGDNMIINESVFEVISMPIMSIDTDDDETTGISRVVSEVDNDVWYNLKGQRIDTPTRKGLYIKNGKKVVVK